MAIHLYFCTIDKRYKKSGILPKLLYFTVKT